jgi:hypothetical protein
MNTRPGPAFLTAIAAALLPLVPAQGAGALPAAADGKNTNNVVRMVVPLILWPTDGMLTPRAKEILKEERRVFGQELRHLKEWVPDNMRGAISKTWAKGGKTMFSESHAIDHVPDMPTEQVEQIIAEMEDGARDTVLDNIERFKAALARRVPVFARGCEQFKAGEYAKAAETIHNPLTKEVVLHAFFKYQYDTLPPMIYGLVNHVEGECYSLDGTIHDAMVRYMIVCKAKLPLSMTFSATARIRLADMYERTDRPHFAISFYQKVADKYADSLCDTEILRLHVRARTMMEHNSFREAVALAQTAARMMDRGYAGPVLGDFHAQLVKRMRTFATDWEGDGRAHMQINWEMMGGEITSAGLQEGASPTKFSFTKDVAMAGSDDWGKLKPREQQEIIQKFFQSYPDEYRQMIEDYFRTISREGAKVE